jgi:hypothetical protein
VNVLTNTNNNFTAYQVSQLVQLENDEATRMDLAKAGIRSIIDREHISLLYNVFTSQARREELAAFFNSNATYTGTSTTGSSSTYKTPMSDANFARLVDETRRLWIPGAKKNAVLTQFTTANNYFTTNQAIQLIQLDNDEPDRYDMAKASFQTLVDPQNFSQVFSLFTNQTYINDLTIMARNGQ